MRFAELGLLVARLCDVAFPDARLEQSILESGTAKGRLIHYHSPVERLSEAKRRRRSNAPMQKHSHDYSFCNKSIQPQAIKQNNSAQSDTFSPHGIWQQWHYDYGILTVVTAPMFQVASVPSAGKMEDQVSGSVSQLSSSAECPPPDGHSCLQIMNPSTGLAQHAVVPHDLLIVQVGEAAQILSGGRLCATAHCVSELVSTRSFSRETFVLFLQPAWQKALVPPEGYNRSMVLGTGSWGDEESKLDKDSSPEFRSRILEFNRSVPPLASRWHESSTFAEFSKQTTRQYYGANGYQSSN
ncbi:hypothetical protein O6H91_23G030200 [Diphasiastrum complanatum]|nr:hypothetical protein O6H91_23G030200 [Diphasiastrum complanatum]